jgi:hypothetical protein
LESSTSVAVRDPDLADAAGGQIEEGGASETAQADDQDTAPEQFELALFAHFRDLDIAVVDLLFEIGETITVRRHKKTAS